MSWKEWREFVEAMAIQHQMKDDQRVRVLRLGSIVKGYVGGPAPQTGVVDGLVQMVWDRGRHHLEVDVDAAGDVEWFYRDRETERTDSSSRRRTGDPLFFMGSIVELVGFVREQVW